MRAQHQQINLLQQGGANEDDIILARGRYRATSSEYTRFSKAMKLPQQRERVTVDGLGNVGVGKYKISQKSLANSENSGIIKPKLADNEESAIQSYISSESYKINEKLRSGEELSEDEKIIVDGLDTALQKMPKYEGTVYRSLDSSIMENPAEFWRLH